MFHAWTFFLIIESYIKFIMFYSNILGHHNAMKADNVEQFLDSMKDKIDNLWDNDIIEIVKKSGIKGDFNVLNAVWSHRRKQKPNGEIYRHPSRICADGSQQKQGILRE